jgi:hypothetical protein
MDEISVIGQINGHWWPKFSLLSGAFAASILLIMLSLDLSDWRAFACTTVVLE